MVCLETSKVSAATVDVSCLLSEKSVNFLKRQFFKLSACVKERIGYWEKRLSFCRTFHPVIHPKEPSAYIL